MSTQKVFLRVKGPTLADTNVLTQDLRARLLDSSAELNVQQQKEQGSTQDMGATLILIFGAPAIVAIAKGIADWLTRHEVGQVEIEFENGKVRKFKATEVSGSSMDSLLEFLRGRY